jgi:hypothetical protein
MTRNESIAWDRRTGKTLTEIGTTHGISRQRVLQILDRMGAPRVNPNMLPRDERRFREYIKAGFTAKEMATALGFSVGAVHAALRDLDLKIPKSIPPHGTTAMYRRRCRCELCRKANTDRCREGRRALAR